MFEVESRINNLGYVQLISEIWNEGDDVTTRGESTKSIFGVPAYVVSPIITVRKTAWKTALKELEWFMSGSSKCPEGVLKDIWWKGQLGPNGLLLSGYPEQLRDSIMREGWTTKGFDQVAWLREELKKHPQSRRLILSTWNPGEMSSITFTNNNPMVPACCHMNFMQFQVRYGLLQMNTVFRSTDTVLGLPHNLVQHRALQLYFAHHAGVPAADGYTLFMNDTHVYSAHAHFAEWCTEMLDHNKLYFVHDTHMNCFDLTYTPTSEEFNASDFSLTRELPEPIYTDKIIRTL